MQFAASNMENDKKFDKLRQSLEQSFQASIKELKEQNEVISTSMELISKQYDDMTEELKRIEIEKKDQQKYIQSLEQRIDYLERKNTSNCIEIRGVPKDSAKETKDELVKIAKKTALALEIPMEERDIKDIYRGNSKADANKPIVFEVSNSILKEKLLKSVKAFNDKKSKEAKLNTSHLQITGAPRPIYISESLTPRVRKLFHLARGYAKENEYRFCWTTNGRVFLRKDEDLPHIRIDNETELHNLTK